MKGDRNYNVDLIKVTAMAAVVAIHILGVSSKTHGKLSGYLQADKPKI